MPKKSLVSAEKSDDINISPLIDMVFILLIFFIVTTVFIDERGFEATKPEASQDPSDEENKPVTFLVDDNNKIFHEGKEVGLGAIQRVYRNAAQEDAPPVVIRVEPGSRAGIALMIWDEALQAGAEAINLAEEK